LEWMKDHHKKCCDLGLLYHLQRANSKLLVVRN